MANPPQSSGPTLNIETEMDFHFEKSPYWRVIHVDGAFGGISPATGLVNMSVFNERMPIPRKITHKLEHGGLGPEITERREGRSGIFRELEADLVMTVETATSLRNWLDDKINEAQRARELIASLQAARSGS